MGPIRDETSAPDGGQAEWTRILAGLGASNPLLDLLDLVQAPWGSASLYRLITKVASENVLLDSFTISMDGWYISYLLARSIFIVTEKRNWTKQKSLTVELQVSDSKLGNSFFGVQGLDPQNHQGGLPPLSTH